MPDWTTLATPAAGSAVSIATFFDPLKDDITHTHDLVARLVTNNTGTVAPRGYVGVLSGTADNSLLATTTTADGRTAAVVIEASIAAGSAGYVAVAGHTNTLLVTGPVARDDTLQTSGSAGYAVGGSISPFARARQAWAGPGAGTIAATLYVAPVPATPRIAAVLDTANVQRFIPNATSKTIADGAATSLFEVAIASGAVGGGLIFYLVRVFDGTDWQALSGMVSYSAVNKAGTLTATITEVTGNQAKAVSAGTLTLAWTLVTGASKVTAKLQPTGSLTETTPYDVTYSVLPLIGAVTLL